MERFLFGHSSGQAAAQLTQECLMQIGEIPVDANLGFIYASDTLAADLKSIVDRLKAETGVTNWTGSLGVGIVTTGVEHYDRPALAVMIGAFPPGSFITLPLQTKSVADFASKHRGWFAQQDVCLGVLHCDPTNPHTPGVIDQLATVIPGAFFIGGLTSSNADNLQVADAIVSGGVSGILFGADTPVVTAHTQGCSPVAGQHEITRCQHNILIELDGRPALDVLKEDIGEVLAKDLSRIGGYIFAGFPVAESDTGDYLVRNLVGIDTDSGMIAIAQRLEKGTKFMFCRRDGNSAREDMQRMLRGVHDRLKPPIKGALYYSCLGRGRYQFGPDSEELKMIQAELGDIPLVGFFANGEIFRNRLYGYTGVLCVFS